jgi:hypothetical protein
MMTFDSTVILGMLALAAWAGCATAIRPVAGDTSLADHTAASPATVEREACTDNGGWYDTVAGACVLAGL